MSGPIVKTITDIFNGNRLSRSNIKSIKSSPFFFYSPIVIILIVALLLTTFISIFYVATSIADSKPKTAVSNFTHSLPTPPKIQYAITYFDKKLLVELLKDCNITGKKRKLINACNYQNTLVTMTADSITQNNPGSFNIGQICDIFDFCYGNWTYVNDPEGSDEIEYASNTLIHNLHGDCEDFAVLIASMILSMGGDARICYAYDDNNGHAFTEVNIGHTRIYEYLAARYNSNHSISSFWTRTDKLGNKWLNLDWFSKYPGGKYVKHNQGIIFYIKQEYCEDFIKAKP